MVVRFPFRPMKFLDVRVVSEHIYSPERQKDRHNVRQITCNVKDYKTFTYLHNNSQQTNKHCN